MAAKLDSLMGPYCIGNLEGYDRLRANFQSHPVTRNVRLFGSGVLESLSNLSAVAQACPDA
jgi:hypothetical protein